MKLFELAIVFLIAFLDATTTFACMSQFGCAAENNMFLRNMCYAYGSNAVWLWLPLEFVAILLVYYAIKMLRLALSSRIKARIPPVAEILFLVMTSTPVLNNILVLVCRTSLSDLLAKI